MARRDQLMMSRKSSAWLLSSLVVTLLAASCGGTTPTGSGPSSTSGDTASTTGTAGGGGFGGMTSGTGGAAGAGGMGGSGGAAATTGTGGTTTSGGGLGGAGGTMGTAATVCVPAEEVVCYSGPAGTAGVGLCQANKKVCDALGAGFGPCEGEVLPEPETCLDADDNDCNGETNEDGAGCACTPNTVTPEYSSTLVLR